MKGWGPACVCQVRAPTKMLGIGIYPKDRELHKHEAPSRITKSFERGLEFVVVLRRLNMLRDGPRDYGERRNVGKWDEQKGLKDGP